MRPFVKYLAIIVLLLGFIFVLWFILFLRNHFVILTPEGSGPDMTLTGAIGDFIGGVVGTAFSFSSNATISCYLNGAEPSEQT